MDKKTQKIGVICSIVQIILSIICLICRTNREITYKTINMAPQFRND